MIQHTGYQSNISNYHTLAMCLNELLEWKL